MLMWRHDAEFLYWQSKYTFEEIALTHKIICFAEWWKLILHFRIDWMSGFFPFKWLAEHIYYHEISTIIKHWCCKIKLSWLQHHFKISSFNIFISHLSNKMPKAADAKIQNTEWQ